MKLSKEQTFEVKNNFKIGHMRCSFENKKMSNQWIPLYRSNNKTNSELKEIQKVINEIMDKYNTFQKIVHECDAYYKKEIDYMFDGINYNTDLFLSKGTFNYWVRLIPQKGEYNIYISVYDKETGSDKQ
ncbi:hypothetical protein [Clostridium felsineum]|uniref:Uncharacterized protein n=1 Tax=Clostridium felsineum TaxID=36839 RepID=A0A1S8KY88_9CLOT|nr:hypothetical protein [Clostridium felsineum]URZ05957.1 hypothetical protein CLROS_012890 [Clostridium felsineum]URZ10994.1 hypothetical protein CROST_017100 [Clostridium felsineum]